jgi:hypothetical protein
MDKVNDIENKKSDKSDHKSDEKSVSEDHHKKSHKKHKKRLKNKHQIPKIILGRASVSKNHSKVFSLLKII